MGRGGSTTVVDARPHRNKPRTKTAPFGVSSNRVLDHTGSSHTNRMGEDTAKARAGQDATKPFWSVLFSLTAIFFSSESCPSRGAASMVSSTRRRPRAGSPTDAQAERECRTIRAEAVADEKGAGAVEMAQLCV